jgi:hypothetical protein
MVTAGVVAWKHSPTWSANYLILLDVRLWPPWKSIACVVVFVESLMIVRFWPRKKNQEPTSPEEQ